MTSNHTIWFGHFPTSCIISEDEGVRDLIGKLNQGLVYLCGHLHRLGGVVPHMYALQREGFLELELGDWKDNRMYITFLCKIHWYIAVFNYRYRLLAIDHGIFSFTDIQHRDWPVVLITNPKHALFVIPGKENLNVIRQSTHIR